MLGVRRRVPAFSQTVSIVLGLCVLALALALGLWSVEPKAAVDWAFGILGPGFIALLSVLLLGTVYCLVRLRHSGRDAVRAEFWFATGLQCANGIATLALTYTLFGISVGIGALAGQGLTPETVEAVIRDLTASFSLAFMTTVTGLPLSALMRGFLVVTYSGLQVDNFSSSGRKDT